MAYFNAILQFLKLLTICLVQTIFTILI